jgi:hypothetical protein
LTESSSSSPISRNTGCILVKVRPIRASAVFISRSSIFISIIALPYGKLP